MPVHVSRRRNGVWYARGSVRAGQATAVVAEFSTGCRSRAEADAVAARRDAELRRDLIEGPAGRARRLAIADCLLAYLQRPGGVSAQDHDRLQVFNEAFGAASLADAPAAWTDWLRGRGRQLKPASAARWRTVLQAALYHGAAAAGAVAPRLPGVRGGSGADRLVYLTDDERRRLLAAYNPRAACPVLVLAYQGLRTQEALRLDWRRVDFQRRTLFLPASETKTGRGRSVPMHPRVEALLFGLWCAAGRPDAGPAFLSSKHAPYADTRGREDGTRGGNPLARAHATACRRAGITGFRVHDWRHDWAARAIMAGVDIYTLMRLGGWASLRSVQRYLAVSPQHVAEALRAIR